MRQFIVIIGVFLSLVFVASAQDSTSADPKATKPASRFAYVSGYRLVEWLEQYKAAEKKDPNASYYHVGKAWGFIAGVVDGNPEKIRTQNKLSMKQLVRFVDFYLAAHPDRLHEPAAVLVIDALNEIKPSARSNEAQ